MGQRVRWGDTGCARITYMQIIPTLSSCPSAALQVIASREATKLSELHSPSGEFVPSGSNVPLIRAAAVDTICPGCTASDTPAPCVRNRLPERSADHQTALSGKTCFHHTTVVNPALPINENKKMEYRSKNILNTDSACRILQYNLSGYRPLQKPAVR